MFTKNKVLYLSLIGSLLCSAPAFSEQPVTERATNEVQPQAQQVADVAVQVAETATQVETEESQEAEAESAVETAAQLAATQMAQEKLQQILGETNVQFATELAELYAENRFSPIWENKAAEKRFLQHYVVWVLSGVSGYAAEELSLISQTTDPMIRDILLSDAFLNYLYYQENLKKSSTKWLYGSSGYKAGLPSQDRLADWKKSIADGELNAFVESLIPTSRRYRQAAEKVLQSLPDSIGSSITVSETLKPGMQTADVKNLAAILKEKGFLAADYNSDIYHDELLDAVKRFQAENGLTADGIVGAGTRNVLNRNLSSNLYKLSINAQRLSILPDQTNGIFVNIPTYQLRYYRDGKLVLDSKVIVGKKDRQTPVMSSRLSNVVVNPPWNAPVRNINQDIIPKVRQDPSYIYRKGYTIIDGKGRTIDPYTIDWENMTVKNFPYRLRQAPGGDSALGNYKFNMPSSDAIYLHDTPSRGLFARHDRALSSGCVRVHKADELATLLLQENGWSNERKKQVLASKKTTSANLTKRDDVYLYYVTAWVDNGKIYTAPDIYGHDRKLAKTNVNWKAVKAMLF
ncbi:L,D-transpeptidase family protein [Chelonobacter oris]|uniref:L,D-transpeptidase family protein n=1 Tax=Chelonobacter oris TaxID=505317 RepID=UPI000A6891BF|nr:L,D-transpeptidase family protein [Chelonobacter oris]